MRECDIVTVNYNVDKLLTESVQSVQSVLAEGSVHVSRMVCAAHRCWGQVGSGTTGGQHSDFTSYYGHLNIVWMFVKDMPSLLFWLMLPLHVALHLVVIVWFSLRGQGGVILRTKLEAVLCLLKIWRKGRLIQKTLLASVGDI